MTAFTGGFFWLTDGTKSPGDGGCLSQASWMVLILSSSSAGQQRAGCPHTAKALKPNAEAAPPKAIVTRSCVTAPKDSGPLLHSFSCRQSAGCGGGSDWKGGRGPKLKLEKETRVSSRSSQRPTSLNSTSEEVDSVFKDALVIC